MNWGATKQSLTGLTLGALVPLLVWVACGVYLASRLAYGWNPHDEGLLAQTALRVLGGELPHRDFDDAYTGGLAMYHAGVFRLLGTSLISLRIALLAAYLVWLPIVYWIARRFGAWGPATFVSAIVAVWSVPNSLSAMPSWYNLFFATAGAAALCRFLESQRRRWLVAAGVAGGLSVLAKVTGLAYVAAGLLVLVWNERGETTTSRAYSWFVTASLILFVAVLSRAVARLPGVSPQWHFVVPAATLSAFLLWREWRGPPTGHVGRLIGTGAWFLVGIAIPIAVFLVPYVLSGSVHALVQGALIAPQRRFEYAQAVPTSLRTVWAVTPWVIALVPWGRPSRATMVVVGAVLAGFLVAATRGGAAYAALWTSLRHIAPVLVIAGTLAIARGARGGGELWTVLCMTALTGLVQFPYAGSHYFSYFATFPILLMYALVSASSSASLGTLVGAFFLGFGLLCTNPGKFLTSGQRIPADQLPSVKFDGLVVGATEAHWYEQVVALVQAHSADGGYVYAAPDLPEIAAFSNRKNPTRIIYDFLDDPRGHDTRVLQTLDEKHVQVIVIVVVSWFPTFSPPIDADLQRALEARYPESESVGPYMVRWR
jgi:Dolichyl-phosphate-mannose-protein mannosyltransferase